MKTFLLIECPDPERARELQQLLEGGSCGDYGPVFDDWCSEFGESGVIPPEDGERLMYQVRCKHTWYFDLDGMGWCSYCGMAQPGA